ncbi:putative purine nucleoside phosphorylase [Neolecta irregularis DAH-3]|uniref:Purine nucleoside phosphorylase n=1 Tax=Neolecta irregularis (strain DAH-3) TaxID=1198029 RepID=A0A1U7LRS9_NEOID|nr:putative purine nucleoside phosphorylase [Neolecta irregularis DAH-3]|eukprot:OLL25328.1 putative purine nucleoside phosphorylase [Neolecta irregularis DAH-3]
MIDDIHSRALETADFLKNSLPDAVKTPRVGIICGSGLGGLVNALSAESRVQIAYSAIPNFAISTVQGHASKLVFGLLGEKQVATVAMVGRFHFYEGYDMKTVTFPILVMKLLGIEALIITNAAGGLNENYAVGDIVLVKDHLNLAGMIGMHPLRGPNDSNFGVRFPALSDAYDLELRKAAFSVRKKVMTGKRNMYEGIYAFVAGPSYETRAEARMIRNLGADVVGMSTCPEVIVARHCDIRVLCLSLCTNKVILDEGPSALGQTDSKQQSANISLAEGKTNHEEVLIAGLEASNDCEKVVAGIVDMCFS